MKNARYIVLLLVLSLSFSVAGCLETTSSPVNNGGKTSGGTVSPQPPVKPEEGEKVVLKVYRIAPDGENLTAESCERELKAGQKPEEVAVNILLGEAPKDKKLSSAFPAGVKLRGLKVENSMAVADLSKDIIKPGGSMPEMLMVYSLVNTLTEFPAIKNVQILIEGKKVETISGHMDVFDPLKRNDSLVKK